MEKHICLPAGGTGQAAEHLNGGGFSGAVYTEQRKNAAFIHRKRNVVHGGFVRILLGKPGDYDGFWAVCLFLIRCLFTPTAYLSFIRCLFILIICLHPVRSPLR